MKKVILPILLFCIFLGIAGMQYYESYQFRIKPPSEKWAKSVVVSEGKVKNTPKIIAFKGNYVVAHDNGSMVKIIVLDKVGKTLLQKEFPGGDEILFDLNLLTDGSNIYVNWLYSLGNTKNILNLKLNDKLEEIDRWEMTDIRSSIQIGNSVLAISYPGKIVVFDMVSGDKQEADVKLATKLCGTKTDKGYIIAYYDTNEFRYINYNMGMPIESKIIMHRPMSSRDMFLKTALACDENYGYIIIDRKYKIDYGQSLIITFPLKESKGEEKLEGYGNYKYEVGNGTEKGLRLNPAVDFTYSPISVSSGKEARFIIGAPRSYGRSERQFDLLDFTYKDGKLVSGTYIDNSRQGTTMPWIDGEAIVYLDQTKFGQYNVCLTSQGEAFKSANNVVRKSELKLAALDTVTSLINSIFGVFTVGLKWILPGMFLISIATFFGYKLSERMKVVIFGATCVIVSIIKLMNTKNLFYGYYGNMLPSYLNSVIVGLVITAALSIFTYCNGIIKYKRILSKNPDALPILAFVIALFTDSILTQFIYTPFIM